MNKIVFKNEAEEQREKAILFRITMIAMVLGCFLVYPVLQKVSFEVALYSILCCFLGILLMRDASIILQGRLRIIILRLTDAIVVDNIMRSIFDGETGLLACCSAAFVANATMYNLPTTVTQRTQLLQSALNMNDKEARTLLQEPGGCRLLLPSCVKDWLEPVHEPESGGDCTVLGKPVTLPAEEASEMSASETSQEDRTPHVSNAAPDAILPPPRVVEINPQPEQNDMAPVEIFGSIIHSFLKNKLQRLLQSIPDGSIEGIGLAAGVSLLLQLSYSKTARNVLRTAISGSATLGSSVALLGSILVMGARSSAIHTNAQPNESRVAKSPRNIIRDFIAQMCSVRKWQGLLAAIVLFYVGRNRSQPRGRRRMRR